MSNEIARHFTTGSVLIASTASATTSTPRFPFGRYAGGGVIIGNTGGGTQINWHASAAAEDLPRPIYSDGASVTSAVTVGCLPIPDACFGFPFVAPVLVGGTTCAMTVCVKG
jgi:hypothetical protein